MPTATGPRIAFVKAGNAAAELRLLGPAPDPFRGGPYQYTAGFLALTHGCERLLLSMAGAEDDHAEEGARGLCRNYLSSGRAGKIALLAGLVRRIRAFGPDVVLCATPGPVFWATSLAARLARAPLLFSSHNAHATDGESAWKRCLARVDASRLRRCEAILCNGDFLHGQLLDLGMDPDRLITFKARFDSPESGGMKLPPAPYILFTGRMVRDKGIFDLLHAAAPLLAAHPDLSLVYAGDGPAREPLRREAEQGLHAARVHVLGKVRPEEVGALMAGSLFSVAPTRSRFPEGRPKAVVESLVAGRPVVAPASAPFLQDLIHGENSLLYPPDDAEAMGAALKSLLDDPALLQRLADGAARSGAAAMVPETDFRDALRLALERCGVSLPG